MIFQDDDERFKLKEERAGGKRKKSEAGGAKGKRAKADESDDEDGWSFTDGEDDDTEGRGGIRISMKPKNRIKPGRPRQPRDAPPRVVILDEGVPPHGGPGDGEHRGGAVLLAAM